MKGFDKRLKRLTQTAYLLIESVRLLEEENATELSVRLAQTVQSCLQRELTLKSKPIRISSSDVSMSVAALPATLTDWLLVALEADFKAFLMESSGRSVEEQSEQIESLLAKVCPKYLPGDLGKTNQRQGCEWQYKDVILLVTIRDAIVHADGKVNLRDDKVCNRLVDAGWNKSELQELNLLSHRKFRDFFRFKSAVRSLSYYADKIKRADRSRGVA